MDDTQRIAEIETRHAAATPEPWEVDDESWGDANDVSVYVRCKTPPFDDACMLEEGGNEQGELWLLANMGDAIAPMVENFQSHKNGTFIAHSITDVRFLLDKVKHLKVVLQRYGSHDEGCNPTHSGYSQYDCPCGFNQKTR